MGLSLTRKLINAHLVAGQPVAGEEIGLSVDQVLLTDTNGTGAFLQFEAMGFPRLRPPLVVTYIDHNVYQVDSRNSDDHRYLQTASRRYGAWFSKPGNGICHQVHLESWSVPGQLLLGTDSHTPLCGAASMLAIGAGGLDVAVAMGGGPYFLTMPRVTRVWLTGRLGPWVHAKDVNLELLRRYSVRGGSGRIFEYAGPGLAALSLPQRATIANMGAELTLTTSVFPSDEATRRYLALLGRERDWAPLAADADAEYDDQIELDLSALAPLVALPGSPDRVVPVSEIEGTPLEQVMVGSCTNSSWEDMWAVGQAIRGGRVAPSVSFVVFPGSRRILEVMAREGLLADLLAAGATVSEPSCGSCAGIGHVPASGGKSLRAFNRNFPGRSGVRDDQVYLCSPVTAAASALTGVITDPRKAGPPPGLHSPASLAASGAGLVPPAAESEASGVTVIRGPNIKDMPRGIPTEETFSGPVVIRLGDTVSTDDISPSGTQALIFRSNVPAQAEFCFRNVDPDFVARARAAGRGIIVGGEHYGQGSSREAAVLSPLHLGVRAVLAKSFARIHRANLINWGLVPLEFTDPADYEGIERGDGLTFEGLRSAILAGAPIAVSNARSGTAFRARCVLTPRERDILLAGGLLAQTAAAATVA
ncbi:MAG: aconitate hydratase [Candidatus Rokubacteria bacterium]|nr:aconitate hydratase [Candidatus Rokubacteria bacterium]